MMRRKSALCAAGLVLGLMLVLPGTANAFFFFSPFWGSGWGNNWGGWGGPNYYGFGGQDFGSYGVGPHYPSYGYNSGVYNPYGYGPFSYSYSGPITMPGWIASGFAPRSRASLYPALSANENYNNDLLIIPASGTAPDDRARLEIQVPVADAKVWLDGVPMTQTGLTRRFVTPSLDPGSRYSYEVKVQWRDDSGNHEETRRVSVRAGTNPMVAFSNRN